MSLSYRRKHNGKRKSNLSLFFFFSLSFQWIISGRGHRWPTLESLPIHQGGNTEARLISVRSRQTSHGSDLARYLSWLWKWKEDLWFQRTTRREVLLWLRPSSPVHASVAASGSGLLLLSADNPGDLCSFLRQNGWPWGTGPHRVPNNPMKLSKVSLKKAKTRVSDPSSRLLWGGPKEAA